jgi:ABC-type Mn2+/Zn2+ transport system permease subunit
MSTTTIESALLLVVTSATAGLVGSFIVMRRMVLAADALSHVALPGIGFALLLKIHPLVGALFALLLGALFIWGIERRARLPVETVVGVVFSGALAVGSLMTSGDELIHALLGKPTQLGTAEFVIALAGATGVVAFLALRWRELLVSLVSRDIATSIGIRPWSLELQFMIVFAVTVALGVRYLGVLLMGSLVIIPAATAKHVAVSLRGTVAVAVGLAVTSMALGTWIGAATGRETGPPIVLVAVALFLLSLRKRAFV